MKIAVLANDHAGVLLKEEAARHLEAAGYSIKNIGTDDEDPVDYPDLVSAAAREVKAHPEAIGVFICGTGIGACITANKIPGIHCALVHDAFTAKMAREHNHCRTIAIGARVVDRDRLSEILDAFERSHPVSGRHQRRVEKIHALEESSS